MSKYEKPYPIDKRPFLVVKRNPDILEVRQATTTGYAVCPVGGVFDASYISSVYRRGRVQRNGQITPALTSAAIESLLIFEGIIKNETKRIL